MKVSQFSKAKKLKKAFPCHVDPDSCTGETSIEGMRCGTWSVKQEVRHKDDVVLRFYLRATGCMEFLTPLVDVSQRLRTQQSEARGFG